MIKKYTIGAVFTPDFSHVLLLTKAKPNWQKGKLNFPGGSVEEGESAAECIAREFREETALKIPLEDWKYIGLINSDMGYKVDFFTAVHSLENHGEPETLSDEPVDWYEVDNHPIT